MLILKFWVQITMASTMPVMISHASATTVERTATVTAVMIAETPATMLRETEAEGGHTSTWTGKVAGQGTTIVCTAMTCTLGLVVADFDDKSRGCSSFRAKLFLPTLLSVLTWPLLPSNSCVSIERSKAFESLVRLMLQPLATQQEHWPALWIYPKGIIAGSYRNSMLERSKGPSVIFSP